MKENGYEIIYRAADGTEFDDENECQEYVINKDLSEIILADVNLKPINNDNDYDDVRFICLLSQSALDQYEPLRSYYGLPHFNKGMYYYSEEYDEWIEINYEIKKIQEKLDDLKIIKLRLKQIIEERGLINEFN